MPLPSQRPDRRRTLGRHYSYRAGSFYRQDDKTGFPTRAERTRKQWDSQIVDERVFEPRHPQDFVRGRKDDQTVPDGRPLAFGQWAGPFWTATSAGSAVGTNQLTVATVAQFNLGDSLAIMLADGSLFDTVLEVLSGTTMTILAPLPRAVLIGAQVWDYGPSGVIPQYLTTESGIAITSEDGQNILI